MDRETTRRRSSVTANTRSTFLAQSSVSAFVQYLVGLVRGQRKLDHAYVVKSKAWNAHLKQGQKSKHDVQLALPLFAAAFDQYYWLAPDEDDGDGDDDCRKSRGAADRVSYGANKIVLDRLSKDLQTALDEADSNATFLACIKILDWGQVYRGSVRWILQQHDKDRLVKAILTGRDVLNGDSLDSVALFDGETLRMDSGLTKIYSLAGEKSIIYDDRVGAALGLLVRKFLEDEQGRSHCLPEPSKKRGIVPEPLRFMRSGQKSKTRNPSNGPLKFPARGSKPSLTHARSNLLANWIIGEVARECQQDKWTMREIEAALFMIGYDVSGLTEQKK